MTSNELQALFARHGVEDLALRAEVEQFAHMTTDDRMVWLFLEVRASKQQKPITKRLYEFAYIAAFVTYALFDRGALSNLPPFGGAK